MKEKMAICLYNIRMKLESLAIKAHLPYAICDKLTQSNLDALERLTMLLCEPIDDLSF